jgi:pyrimidine operon attenuation protein/uracil phosphoribosyltransferase
VLVDRGGRELPIRPDFTGLTLAVPDHQNINLSRLDDGHLTLTLA